MLTSICSLKYFKSGFSDIICLSIISESVMLLAYVQTLFSESKYLILQKKIICYFCFLIILCITALKFLWRKSIMLCKNYQQNKILYQKIGVYFKTRSFLLVLIVYTYREKNYAHGSLQNYTYSFFTLIRIQEISHSIWLCHMITFIV